MKLRVDWLNQLDKKIWGKNADKLNTYLVGTTLVIVILFGIIAGGGNIFNQWFKWNTTIFIQIMIALAVIMWVINVIESYVAMPSKVAATFRSLLLLATFGFGYYLGYIGTIYILILLMVYLFILLIGSLVSRSIDKKKNNTPATPPKDGSSISFTLQNDGRYLGSDNHYYKKDGNNYTLDQ